MVGFPSWLAFKWPLRHWVLFDCDHCKKLPTTRSLPNTVVWFSSSTVDNVVVHRKLLRRRHVRKLQKERKAVSVSNTTRSSVTFGLQHCSFIDIKLPIHHHVHVASPDRPVRFPQGYRPTVSPIRPRMLHSILPDTNETLVMPPMSPIQSASMRDWEDYRHPALGVKRKLESSFLWPKDVLVYTEMHSRTPQRLWFLSNGIDRA